MHAPPEPHEISQPVTEAAPIGGMTTIDSGEAQSSLLVDGDEQNKPQAQPRRNGEGRTRRPRKPAVAEAAEAPVAEAPAQETATPAPSATEG